MDLNWKFTYTPSFYFILSCDLYFHLYNLMIFLEINAGR